MRGILRKSYTRHDDDVFVDKAIWPLQFIFTHFNIFFKIKKNRDIIICCLFVIRTTSKVRNGQVWMINDAFSFRNVTKKRFSIFLTYMYQRTCVLIAIRTLYNYLFFAWGRLFRYYVSSCLIFCNLFVTIHSPASPFVLS